MAFANLWTTGQKEEFSIDLMRHLPDAPQGTMDLLLIGLMEHAKANGYRWFNLGMAPLSGLAQHRLASIWSRAGTFFSGTRTGFIISRASEPSRTSSSRSGGQNILRILADSRFHKCSSM